MLSPASSLSDGAFEVAFELPTVGAGGLQYVWREDSQKGYIVSALRAGIGMSGVLYEVLDLIPAPQVSLVYQQVGHSLSLVCFWHYDVDIYLLYMFTRQYIYIYITCTVTVILRQECNKAV